MIHLSISFIALFQQDFEQLILEDDAKIIVEVVQMSHLVVELKQILYGLPSWQIVFEKGIESSSTFLS